MLLNPASSYLIELRAVLTFLTLRFSTVFQDQYEGICEPSEEAIVHQVGHHTSSVISGKAAVIIFAEAE